MLDMATIAKFVQECIADNDVIKSVIFAVVDEVTYTIDEVLGIVANSQNNHSDNESLLLLINIKKLEYSSDFLAGIFTCVFAAGVLWTILFAKPTNNYAKTKIYTFYGACATTAINHIAIYAALDTFSGSGFGPIVVWIVLYPAVSALSNMTGPKAKKWLPIYYEHIGNSPNVV